MAQGEPHTERLEGCKLAFCIGLHCETEENRRLVNHTWAVLAQLGHNQEQGAHSWVSRALVHYTSAEEVNTLDGELHTWVQVVSILEQELRT